MSGGGRYDDLVGMFDAKGRKVPCVGFSIGVERVFTILEDKAKQAAEQLRVSEVDVLVCSAGGDLTLDRIAIASELWNNGIKVRELFLLFFSSRCLVAAALSLRNVG